MDRKDFARFKWLWLKQVHDDLGLPRVAYQIAFHLADHLSWEKLEAWPSIETLAKKCGVTSRHVRDCLPSLEKKGHIRIRRGGAGPKSPNYYSLTPKSRPELAPETKSDDSGKGGTTVHPYEDRSMPLRVNCGSAKGEPQFQKGGTTVHPNNKKNNYRNLSAHAREAEANDDRPGGSTAFGLFDKNAKAAANDVRSGRIWIYQDQALWPFCEAIYRETRGTAPPEKEMGGRRAWGFDAQIIAAAHARQAAASAPLPTGPPKESAP